jgi:hypothetical protein
MSEKGDVPSGIVGTQRRENALSDGTPLVLAQSCIHVLVPTSRRAGFAPIRLKVDDPTQVSADLLWNKQTKIDCCRRLKPEGSAMLSPCRLRAMATPARLRDMGASLTRSMQTGFGW